MHGACYCTVGQCPFFVRRCAASVPQDSGSDDQPIEIMPNEWRASLDASLGSLSSTCEVG